MQAKVEVSVMDGSLYNTMITCPVCTKKFEATKVKAKSSKVVSRDSDFCVYYEGINPIFYDILVCEYCGYAAQTDKFGAVNSNEAAAILKNITPRWHKRSFVGERSIDAALEAFKLALLNLQVKKSKSSDIAKVCLRIAWLLRIKKDEKEVDFLNFALKAYSDAYEKERFPIDKLDEYTCMYIIAELYRRVGNFEESVKWFSRLVSSSDARKNAQLMEAAREQFQLAKEQAQK